MARTLTAGKGSYNILKCFTKLFYKCTNTKILLCDETFDGLDPVMRQTVKGLFATEMPDIDFTPMMIRMISFTVNLKNTV